MRLVLKCCVAACMLGLWGQAFATLRVAIYNDDPVGAPETTYTVEWRYDTLNVGNGQEKAVNDARPYEGILEYGASRENLVSLHIDGAKVETSVDIHCSAQRGCSAAIRRR